MLAKIWNHEITQRNTKRRRVFDMNKCILLSIAAALLLLTAVAVPAQKAPSAEYVLEKVAKKLAATKSLGYKYTREFNYPSEDYLSKSVSSAYLDLEPAPGTLGFRFQFSDDELMHIYNGSESFLAIKKSKKIQVDNKPSLKRFGSSAYLYNSPITLKYVLPKIIADKSISKKLSTMDIEGRPGYLVEFSLYKKSFDGVGEIGDVRNDRTSTYHLTIDAKTFLPLEVLVTNDKNKDFMKTTFSNITEKPEPPSDLSWYFTTYTNEYKLDQQVEKKLLAVGQAPPNFTLRQFDSTSQVSLDAMKGKVVLLEFWITHCGFCIAAVPKLNEIAKTYKSAEFEFISINVHDPDPAIASFKKRHNLAYPILAEGEATGDAYGVGGYPAIYLIGKDGKIAYASLGFFEKELEGAIKSSLGK
jgi:thiol-disulfide isomerase/thioredoxin